MSKLILASASPRRQQLLTQAGVPFTIEPADIDERTTPGEAPRDYVLRMAYEKAQHVSWQRPIAFVLGADTIVTIDDEILGKPKDLAEARRMLRGLSSRTHTVMTGLALLHHDRGVVQQDTVSTAVRFRRLSEHDIETYVATAKPLDKAGAYAIQDSARAFVEAFDGCYTNVVGLPVQRTVDLMRAAGMDVPYGTGA
jgi:septum formation protein